MGHFYFEIQADDLNRALNFYGKVFGWKFARMTGAPVEYWRIETKEGLGDLLKRPAKTPPCGCGTNAFVCSMQIDDFDQMAAKIVEAGGQIALPKFPIPSICWQGYFEDTEGNTFGIFQVDETAK